MGFFKWMTEPLVNIMERNKGVELQAHADLTPSDPVKQYIPLSFESYIGQERTKKILKSYIQGVQARNRTFPHVIISGNAGCGKTALARIIAKELGLKFVETITSEVSDIFDLEMKIEECEGGILFLDEIHGIPRNVAESIYTIMQDFTHEGEPIKPFTLIGATTELGEILRNRKPFYDRFKIPLELDDYKPEELAKIAKQYSENTFPQDKLSEETFVTIGKNCKKTPRVALRLLESTIYLNGNIQQTLENFAIIKDGYTHKDLKVLEYIAENPKGIGLQALSLYLNIPTEDYQYQLEPYLLQNKLILRSNKGRNITDAGKEKIQELKNEIK